MATSSEKMEIIYSQWQESGLSRMAFCKQKNINYATFNYWHKRFASKNQTGFSEIRLPVENNFEGTAELIFPSGIKMVFHSTPSVSWLKEFLG